MAATGMPWWACYPRTRGWRSSTAAKGCFRDAPYFVNYGQLPCKWKLALTVVDGTEHVVHFREKDGAWIPYSVVQLGVEDGRIAVVRDYVHVDYLLRDSVVT